MMLLLFETSSFRLQLCSPWFIYAPEIFAKSIDDEPSWTLSDRVVGKGLSFMLQQAPPLLTNPPSSPLYANFEIISPVLLSNLLRLLRVGLVMPEDVLCTVVISGSNSK